MFFHVVKKNDFHKIGSHVYFWRNESTYKIYMQFSSVYMDLDEFEIVWGKLKKEFTSVEIQNP